MAVKVLSLSLDQREWDWLDARASEIGMSRSALVREVIFEMSDKRPKWRGPLIEWVGPKFREAESC